MTLPPMEPFSHKKGSSQSDSTERVKPPIQNVSPCCAEPTIERGSNTIKVSPLVKARASSQLEYGMDRTSGTD